MQKSNIKSIIQNGEFSNDYGKFFGFRYEFANGEVGLANHKTNEPRYKVGDSVTYEITGSDNFGNKRIKFIEEVKPQNGGKTRNGNGQYDTMCLSYAKDLVIAKIIPFEKMYEISDEMYDYIKTKRNG